MNCIHCEKEILIQEIIEKSSFSWPLWQMVWYICSNCHKGNHFRFEKGKIQLIQLLGSPGNEYEIVFTELEKSIDIRVDSEYLHIWFNGNHNEVQAL